MSTFVAVGNGTQSFRRLLDAVAAISKRLPQPVVVQHGVADFAHSGCELHAYVDREEFGRLLASARLVICHAGSGCVIEALRAGRIPVVMPRRKAHGEVVDDHQVEFARLLAEAGRVVVVEGAEQIEQAAARALQMQADRRDASSEPPLVAALRAVLREAEQQCARAHARSG